MAIKTSAPASGTFPLSYYSIRTMSCPENDKSRRVVYSGYAPFTSFLDLPNNQNVRDFLLDAEGKEKKQPTQVHLAIRDTLMNNPEDFSVLNSGIVIVASAVEVDESRKIAKLISPSIINGAQTQGLLKEYLRNKQKSNQDAYPIHVAFQLIITEDQELVAEISIARNFQNDVLSISIAGRKGQLDELEVAFRQHFPDAKLRKSETKLSDDYIFTEKLLQVITALIPAEIWPFEAESGGPVKTFTYAMKTRCLKHFQRLFESVHREKQDEVPKADRDLYKFYLDICGPAWELYQKWQSHPGFKGTGLRAIDRDEKGNVIQVPDGLVFPIIAALSNFVVRKNGKWRLEAADLDDDLIATAKTSYIQIAASNPSTMGKSKACYSSLFTITGLYRRLMAS